MSPPTLWLRAETKHAEHRSPLTPLHCKTLLQNNFALFVERSHNRIFNDEEYENVGCTLVEPGTWKSAPKEAYIIGLKELPQNDSSPLPHTHIYFAHCYKTQAGWKDILKRFADGNGTLLDLEFLVDEKGRRVAAFGFHAGFAGSAVGIDVWCQQQLSANRCGALAPIKPFPNEEKLINFIKGRLNAVVKNNGKYPRVMVMGAHGRCGTGAVDFVRKAGIPEENIIKWDMAETARGGPFKEITEEADIFINCIYLTAKIPPFIDQQLIDSESRKLSVIVDVSCDTTNPNNPLPVYDWNTTFDSPTLPVKSRFSKPLDVVAIDHLPTLVPREASDAFCRDLLPSLLQLSEGSSHARVWNDAKKLFQEKVTLL